MRALIDGFRRRPLALSCDDVTSERHTRDDSRPVRAAILVLGLVLAAPVASLVLTAAHPSGLGSELPLASLWRALTGTALLLGGVAIVVLGVGIGTAWLVSTCDFPGRRGLEAALVLPLAVPTYIVAFCYLDILHPVGPVQTALRSALGVARPADLWWFPEVRSTGMCALLLGLVLYPYVYLPTRALFLSRGAELLDAASSLGARPGHVFRRIALPLARPGIVAGASFALLEALNDVGASELLGVRTLTLAVYATWVNRSDLPGAAQLALGALLVVVVLLASERWARRRRDLADADHPPARRRLAGPAGLAALALGSLPVLVGFGGPAWYLLVQSVRRIGAAGLSPALLAEAWATVVLAGATTGIVVAIALLLAGAARLVPTRGFGALGWTAALGYGVPGAVLAVGCLAPLAALDELLHEAIRLASGLDTRSLLIGSSGALVYVYVVRFLAVGLGPVEAALVKVPLSLDEASFMLGSRPVTTARRIHLPIVAGAVASGALLVFVDTVKELPATLLLRPLNVETLATHVYGEAIRGTYEDGAVAALLIVAAGLVPLALLIRVGRRG